MIELAQAANLIVQPQDGQSVVEVGRICGAWPAGFWSSRRSSFDAIRAAAPAFTIRMEQQDLPQ